MEYTRKPKCSEVTLLWCTNEFDGPITGIADWSGTKYYFNMCDNILYCPETEAKIKEEEARYDEWLVSDQSTPEPEFTEHSWYRRYLLFPLTPEEIEFEEYWHTLFLTTKSEDYWSLLHKKPKKDYTNREAVGWFEV